MKWKTLRHNGVAFPPEYDYRGLTVKIKGQPYPMNPEQEEMLMAWAKKKDTPYVQDRVFQQNFLGDLVKVLPEALAGISLDDIDWTEMHAIVEREKTANLSPEEKKKRSAERKALREELKAKFGTATIDETEAEIGAYMVEPPGILMGRGEHPLRGKWKRRVAPEDVTLNLDKEAPVPPAPEGHDWGKIVHEKDSMWIASWYDELSGKRKYVWLADSAKLRQDRDKEKYLKAAKLETGLERVRAEIRKKMDERNASAQAALDRRMRQTQAEIKAHGEQIVRANAAGDTEGRKKLEDELAGLHQELEKLERRREKVQATEIKTRQIATVCYLIDKLAMRVGDEKDEDEADTVGASTLRVEHVNVRDDKIEFDFLGKDSVQWQKVLPLDDGERVLARNLQEFMQGKQVSEQIFDKIDSTHVNRFLSSIVPGLTAKVFRTYHATTTVRTCLRENGNLKSDVPMFEKEYTAKMANLQAAITCNHKRTPPKNWEQGLAKKEETVEKLRAAKPDLAKFDAEIAKRKTALNKLLAEQRKLKEQGPSRIEEKEQALAKLREQPAPGDESEAAKLKKKQEAAEQALEKAKADLEEKTERMSERVAKAREALKQAQAAPAKAQQDYEERIAKAERQLELARATRDYNLGTSLKNYIDPRIYKAWGDHVGFEWRRLYTKALQRKFGWVDQSRAKWNTVAAQPTKADEDNSASSDGDTAAPSL